MNDEIENLRREVERLTAERDEYTARYDDTLRSLLTKEWEGVTQADLHAAIAAGDTFSRIIARLEGASETAADEPVVATTN